MRVAIKSLTSLILAQFQLWAYKLPALEGLLDLRKCCPDDSDFSFDRISISLADNEDSHKILDEFDFGLD